MPPVANGSQQRQRGFRAMPAIPALLRPGLNNLPIPLEFRVLAKLFQTRFLKAGSFDQIAKVVRVAGLHLLLVRELAALSCLRDASFDRSLYCVARQVVCTIEVPQLEQGCRLLQPDFRKLLEIPSVHAHPS